MSSCSPKSCTLISRALEHIFLNSTLRFVLSCWKLMTTRFYFYLTAELKLRQQRLRTDLTIRCRVVISFKDVIIDIYSLLNLLLYIVVFFENFSCFSRIVRINCREIDPFSSRGYKASPQYDSKRTLSLLFFD